MKVRAGQGRAQAERLRAYGELRRIEQVLPAARAEIIAAAEAIVAESALAEMNATDIDELKDFGAPVGALQSAGFRKVAQLAGQTEISLQRYRGIGEVTAAATIQAYRTFEESARARVRLLPDPDHRRPADTRLLVALVKYETLLRDLGTRPQEAQIRFDDADERLRVFRAQTKVRDHLFSVSAQQELARRDGNLASELRWVAEEARGLADLRMFEGGPEVIL